jgi:hypothetical protein
MARYGHKIRHKETHKGLDMMPRIFVKMAHVQMTRYGIYRFRKTIDLGRAGGMPFTVTTAKAFCDLTESARLAKTRRRRPLPAEDISFPF